MSASRKRPIVLPRTDSFRGYRLEGLDDVTLPCVTMRLLPRLSNVLADTVTAHKYENVLEN